MIEGQTVIYTARTVQDAHQLKNLLAEERIEAVVLTDTALTDTSQLGLGVDAAGWATGARVVVAEEDARRARQLAVRFDRKAASATGRAEDAVAGEGSMTEESPMVLDVWPKCPECDARRWTRCPICNTTGRDFPAVDMGFIWIPGPDGAASESPGGSCGPQGCTPSGEATPSAIDAARRVPIADGVASHN